MADGYFKVNGLKELEARFLDLNRKMAGAALKGAVMDGAQIIVKEARNRAPVGTIAHPVQRGKGRVKVQPGFLRSRIGRRTNKETKASVTVSVSVFRRKSDPGPPYYWRFLEFGTSKLPARPFMRPAFDTAKQAAVDRITERMHERLHRVGG